MVEIRQVDAFEAAAMAALVEPVFGNQARHAYLRELTGAEADDRQRALHAALPKLERVRIGAFAGERLVGCSSAWFDHDAGLHIGLSVVDPLFRRQRVYTRLLGAVEAVARERGSLQISSRHVATNNPVLIAKLRLGYVVAGTEYDEQMGLLVRLVLRLSPERRELYAARTGTLASPRLGHPGGDGSASASSTSSAPSIPVAGG